MRGLLDILFGTSVLVVTGEKKERFLNILAFHHIDLLDVARQQDGETKLCIRVRRGSVSEVLRLASKYHLQVTYITTEGIPNTCQFCKKRYSFFIGAICCFVFLMVMSQAIWKIEFIGNSYHSKEALLTYLSERKIGYGAFAVFYDWEKEERLLRKRYTDVAWCSMSVEGCRLRVSITEGDEKGHHVQKKSRDLCASHAATITSIVTRRGTARVKAHSKVKKGTILIEGAIEYYDDAGALTGKKKCVADGEVRGVYRQPIFWRIPLRQQQRKHCKKWKQWGLKLGQRMVAVPIFKQGKQKEEVLTTYQQVGGEGGWNFPCCIITKDYYAMVSGQKCYTVSEAKRVLEHKMQRLNQKLHKNNSKIIEKNLHLEHNKKEVLLTGFVVVRVEFKTEWAEK